MVPTGIEFVQQPLAMGALPTGQVYDHGRGALLSKGVLDNGLYGNGNYNNGNHQ